MKPKLKRKPLPPRPDGKPRRKLANRRNAEAIADALVRERGAFRIGLDEIRRLFICGR